MVGGMSTDEDRERLAGHLMALPVRELVDVLRRALPHFTEEAFGTRTALTLASVTHYADDAEPGLTVDLVAGLIATTTAEGSGSTRACGRTAAACRATPRSPRTPSARSARTADPPAP
jgi:hypothetical protein